MNKLKRIGKYLFEYDTKVEIEYTEDFELYEIYVNKFNGISFSIGKIRCTSNELILFDTNINLKSDLFKILVYNNNNISFNLYSDKIEFRYKDKIICTMRDI